MLGKVRKAAFVISRLPSAPQRSCPGNAPPHGALGSRKGTSSPIPPNSHRRTGSAAQQPPGTSRAPSRGISPPWCLWGLIFLQSTLGPSGSGMLFVFQGIFTGWDTSLDFLSLTKLLMRGSCFGLLTSSGDFWWNQSALTHSLRHLAVSKTWTTMGSKLFFLPKNSQILPFLPKFPQKNPKFRTGISSQKKSNPCSVKVKNDPVHKILLVRVWFHWRIQLFWTKPKPLG